MPAPRDMLKLAGKMVRGLEKLASWDTGRAWYPGGLGGWRDGKWMMTGARILLLYDPTRGVDVGTKSEIYGLIRDFTDGGGTVLMYSSELPELVNLSHRILVMYGGQVACELAGPTMTAEACMAAAVAPSAGGEGVVKA